MRQINIQQKPAIKFAAIAITACLALVGCATNDGSHVADGAKLSGTAKDMLNRINEINANAPSSYDIGFSVDVLVKRKSYKLAGSSQFTSQGDKLYVVFSDYIFKSPMFMMFNEGDDIVLYYPSDKKLYKTTNSRANLKNFWNVNLSFNVLKDLITGKIPLIENFAAKEGGDSKDAVYLILENDSEYETISFKDGLPDKIKITNKTDRTETEIYLSNPRIYGESLIYRKFAAAVKSESSRVDISLNNVKVNVPVTVKTISDIKLPSNVTFYNR